MSIDSTCPYSASDSDHLGLYSHHITVEVLLPGLDEILHSYASLLVACIQFHSLFSRLWSSRDCVLMDDVGAAGMVDIIMCYWDAAFWHDFMGCLHCGASANIVGCGYSQLSN
jgi:hypothetical protein